MSDEALRYPIGKFEPEQAYSPQELYSCIERIASLPARMSSVIGGFDSRLLSTRYREGGWTARQVVHHVADSHSNAYIRFKWALTEETPMIKPYNEKKWAETPEIVADPQLSLDLLKALHAKWVVLLKTLRPEELLREYIHPETNKKNRLDRVIAMYAWHGDHHLGHLKIIEGK